MRINLPLSNFNYHLFGTNVANFNKIHCRVSEQQLLKKWNLKTLGVDGVEGGHFVVISIAADLSVPDSSNAFRHSVSDSDIQ